MLQKIISGGQTGTDRAALDAALTLTFPCGGWCPKGRIAEDGIISDEYPLREMRSKDYRRRTRKNIADSDGTLIVVSQWPVTSPGTNFTINIARMTKKPIIVTIRREVAVSESAIEKLIDWCEQKSIEVLNVAGPRMSKDLTIYEKTRELIDALLRETTKRDTPGG